MNYSISGGCHLAKALATSVLVEALLQRSGTATSARGAKSAIDQLAAVSTDPGFVVHEISLLRLRALLARAREMRPLDRDYRDRYRAMGDMALGFEGHTKWVEAMHY